MKRVIFLFALIAVAITSYASTDIPAGSVSGTWTAASSPYLIKGNISVSGSGLRIEPGVHVVFEGHFSLALSNNKIIAVGTPDSMIVFTVADTNGLVNGNEDVGAWKGLRINRPSPAGDTSRLEYCRFEYCKIQTSGAIGSNGVLGLKFASKLSISNCIFNNNYTRHGLECYNSDLVIEDNLFENNVTDNLLYNYESSPLIIGNEIRDNTVDRIFSVRQASSPVIANNLIAENKADYILLAETKCGPLFKINKIQNNELNQYIIKLTYSNARVINNLIVNNDSRIMHILDGDNHLVNNTIANNDIDGSGYLLLIDAEHGKFNGNIIYGNIGTTRYNRKETEPTFAYNLIEGGINGFTGDPFTGIDIGNIDDNPDFKDPTLTPGAGEDAASADFNLETSSPAINKGDPELNYDNFLSSDVYGNARIKYSRIDMGAAEVSIPDAIFVSGTISSDTLLIGDTIKVTGDIDIPQNITLTIAGGTSVIFTGPYKFDVSGNLIGAGSKGDSIYFIPADTNGFAGPDENAGCWKGIIMHSSADNIPSEFNYCVFKFVKGGVLYLSGISQFSARNCVFSNNYDASRGAVVFSSSSTFSIENCLISHNDRNAFYLQDLSTLYLDGSTFSHNTGTYACIQMVSSNLHSRGNLFHNNESPWSGTVAGNVLHTHNSDCYLVNDVVVNNNTCNSGVLNFSGSTASIVNTTVANNLNIRGPNGAVRIKRTNLQLHNTILYGNGSTGIDIKDEFSDPDLYHCLMENGLAGIQIPTGETYTGEFINCLDAEPHFIEPTSGPGSSYDASTANWQILDISPCINKGSPDTTGLGLPSIDFAGNQRISNEIIDIGAFEKRGELVQIIAEPQGGIFCVGDNHDLAVSSSGADTVSIQWKKDGLPIAGAVDSVLKIEDAGLNDEGNYICYITNSYGTVNSAPVLFQVKAPPNILTEPDISWAELNRDLSLAVFAEGSFPMSYQWKKDNVDISSATSPQYNISSATYSDEGVYKCIVSNFCGSDTTREVPVYFAPQLCMVTVSEITGNNLVVWEKNTQAPILAYNIYRESVAAGIYDKIATVPYDNLSEIEDPYADPTAQAYLYKITATDADSNETDIDLCKPHKTIHLLVTTNPELNTTQLAWDEYYGFDYQTYTIFRSATGADFDSIHSISASLNSWTDPAPLTGDAFYRITVERHEACYPEGGGKKAGTGPYQHALSNMDDNKLKVGENPPDSVYLDNNSIEENMLPGSLVGRLVTFDKDTMDYYTYHLVSGEGDEDNDSFALIGELLVSATTFDYETKDSYSVRIRTTDNAAFYLERAFTITITDAQEAVITKVDTPPDSLYLDNIYIAENNNFGDPIGILMTADKDTSDIHTYQFASGTGDDDNIMFMITGNVLRAGYSFDFEDQNQYTIRVQSVDLGGNKIERILIIGIIDIAEPAVGIDGTPDQTLSVYPNPFTHVATIKFANPGNDPYKMILTDISGKVCRIEAGITSSEHIIRRENLKPGIYFIELSGLKTYRGKIILN